MNSTTVARIRAEIEKTKRILLTTHQNPDGDGLGSEIALSRYLLSRGKQPQILNPDPVPERYRFLDPRGVIRSFDESVDSDAVREAEVIFVLDNSSLTRLGRMEAPVRSSSGVRICIDHHSTTDRFWTINMIDETASATGEMIYELIQALGGSPDREAATALYTALVTDTGHFRFSKTSPRTHRIAAELVQCGVVPAAVYQEVYERSSAGFVRLTGMALLAVKVEPGEQIAHTALSLEQIQESGVEDADTSEIVNHLFTIRGVTIALLFKELADGRIKVSLRSKGKVAVHELAARYGGGGHRNASGAVLEGPMEMVVRRIIADAEKLLA